ncbi:uncharacterized protein F5147DRAFT_23702 [Suillus discolor]|uniref:DUF6533 domain-containing protein n=1 Tax=Suillus discolor TaxID=1912936 RepID=A0A9P7FDP7_9AGAM|nr:uncharacterized protein F5147DRAFT_23702 [Suillus discolor]KAG2114349.1 hypothetical protein F5147DRAFT_23702 [Suillus discolor]
MEPSADDVQIAVAWGLHYLAYIRMTQATFWTYDYVCLLHEEWTFLRQSRWTRVKVIYIFARYVPFFSMALGLYMAFAPDENPDKCRVLIDIYSCFGLISLTCSEWIFVLRTCALWNNNRILRVVMQTTFFAVITISAGLLFTGITLSYVVTSMIPGITGCYWSLGGVLYSMSFVFLLICQLGLFSLTLIHVIQSWRTARGHLYTILVKHNIFYYACGVFLSAMNVLTPLLFSDSVFHSFEDLEICVLAILATRMHLYLWHSNQQHVNSSGLQTFLSNTCIFVGSEPEVTE